MSFGDYKFGFMLFSEEYVHMFHCVQKDIMADPFLAKFKPRKYTEKKLSARPWTLRGFCDLYS